MMVSAYLLVLGCCSSLDDAKDSFDCYANKYNFHHPVLQLLLREGDEDEQELRKCIHVGDVNE